MNDHQLTTAELRLTKPTRAAFSAIRRLPVQILLDGVTQNYNVGAIMRLCDAMLVEGLVVCGGKPDIRNRRLVQAAQGTQRWVPWVHAESAESAAYELKAQGYNIVVAEITSLSVPPERFDPVFPICLVVGGERGCVECRALMTP
jgi:tRNA G18 (ribose-2'-O)-methylase SpoU